MAYYTERHGMRKPIETTYDISIQAYALLFQCCEKYKDTIAMGCTGKIKNVLYPIKQKRLCCQDN